MRGSDFLALAGGTVLLLVLLGILLFAALRFRAAAFNAGRSGKPKPAEPMLLSSVLEEAVSKLRAQEQAMSARAEASERLSDEIVSSLTSGLLVVNNAGDVQILNPAGRRLLGLEHAVLPMHYQELLADTAPVADAVRECLESNHAIVRRTLQMPEGARARHLGVTVSPFAGPVRHQGAICLFTDLTAVIELEDQLQLKDTLARLGELTAGIAHEFRNGLATIHGYSRLMDPARLPEAYRPYVTAIRDETEALGKVVTNFLSFAKPESASFTPIDLAGLVQRVVEDFRNEFSVDVEASGTFPVLQGDEVLLRQMVANLIRNGIEACQGAGVVPMLRVEGLAQQGDRFFRLVVHDNGPGIAPAARERLFHPFFTTKAQGTGLGLAIVQKVAVTHNGRVEAGHSFLGGARFEIALPAGDHE